MCVEKYGWTVENTLWLLIQMTSRNVSSCCYLSEQSITLSQKCQPGADKISETELRDFISLPYKYWLEDWQYPQSILYLLSHTNGVNHVSRYQSGTEESL